MPRAGDAPTSTVPAAPPPAAPPSAVPALPAPAPAERRPAAATALALPGATDSNAADERVRRYQAAQTDPVVRELLKLFDADIVGRELLGREEWLRRLGGGDQR